MVGETSRHTKHRPTKEKFYPATYASGGAFSAIGGFSGPDIDDDEEYGYINGYVPEDFDEIEDIKLVFIATATATPMSMRIVTDYCKAGEAYFEHNENVDLQVNTVLNRMTELNLYDAFDIRRLEAGDYFGIQVRRVAGQNTNIVIIGARLKYLYQ